MPKENLFLTSVANVRLFHPITEDLILNGKIMLNTSMTQAIQNQAIYAGKGSKKVFELDYQKEITFAIEDAGFSLIYLALQNGTDISHVLTDYFTEELVVLDATGLGKINGTPVGKLQVEQNDGTFAQFDANAQGEFTVPTMANKEVQVVYAISEMMDVIEISGEKFPNALKMELNTDLRSSSGKVGEVIIDVPQFKPNGAMELSMTHDGVSSSSLEGSALSDSKGNYAYVKIHRMEGQDIVVNSLASNPSLIIFDSQDVNEPVTPRVVGIRGSGMGIVQMKNEDLTWESLDTAVATVDNTGKIEMASGATAGSKTAIHVKKAGLNYIETIEIVVE